MTCPVDPTPLQPPLRTEEFETCFHLLKLATVCQSLTRLLVYQIDTVGDSVLNHLAEQFDVLGYKGWLLANTDAKKRSLIRRSVLLHRTAGTPFSIVEALQVLGLPVSSIEENPPLTYYGFFYNGAEFYNGKRWDRFIVNFSIPVDPSIQDLVYALIDEWKNARSHRFKPYCPLFYNGSWTYNGEEVYDGEIESCAIIIECIPQLQLRNELQLTNNLQLLDFFCDE